MTKYGMTVFLFEPFYQLYKDEVITPTFIRTLLRGMKNDGVEFEPLSRVEFEQYQQKLGGGRVALTFPQDLYEWYVDINLNRKRGLWIALYKKLIDKFNEICRNINNTTKCL